MNTPHTLGSKIALCAALLLFISNAGAEVLPPTPPSDDMVVVTGWLHSEDHGWEGMVVEVEVNGTFSRAKVSESGRFQVELPSDTEATLRFEKPGHLSKEVLVNTNHSQANEGQRVRRVKFAVIMELERRMAGLTYPGPVGSIGFDEGGGCLAVQHDRSLVKAKRGGVMEF